MDCCVHRDVDVLTMQKDKKISKDLIAESIKRSAELRLLLLGVGESGKSTVMKQLKQIHSGGFGEEEKRSYINGIHFNILESIKALVDAWNQRHLKIDPQHSGTLKLIEKPLLPEDIGVRVTPEMAKNISILWQDPAIKQVYELQSQYQLADSAEYYLNHVERIAEANFTPSFEDLLRVRIPTTGIREFVFSIDGHGFVVVDVGGQRSERKKWMHCFENVSAVLYCTGLSEFDQTLFEDNQTNRILESVKLFHEVCKSKWFAETGLILFLNKEDIFRKKIQAGKSITTAFPDYDGPSDYEHSVKFIEEKFTDVIDPMTGNKKVIHVHITCATDTENIKSAFNEIRDYLSSEIQSPRLL